MKRQTFCRSRTLWTWNLMQQLKRPMKFATLDVVKLLVLYTLVVGMIEDCSIFQRVAEKVTIWALKVIRSPLMTKLKAPHAKRQPKPRRRSNWVTYMKRSFWRQIFIVKNGMIFGFNTSLPARCSLQICSAFGYCQVLHSEEAYAAEVNRGWHWLV